LVAEIKRDARAAKDTVEFTEAGLKKEARQNPGKFGIAKVTGDSVNEAVRVHDDLVDVKTKYSEAQYLADCAGVLLVAAEQRKSMIKDSVSMAIHQLYSSHHDLSKDQHALTRAEGEVNEQDINDLRRSNASAREQESKQELTDVQS
jgi:hypothetical protein